MMKDELNEAEVPNPDESAEPAEAPIGERPEPGTESEPPEPTGSRADREAKYRKRAQEAETERDQLRELVAGLRRGEVERRLAATLTNPADVWHAVKIEDLLDESGAIDGDKVQAAAETIREAHPNWAIPHGLGGNQRPAGPVTQVRESGGDDRWRGAFNPNLTR